MFKVTKAGERDMKRKTSRAAGMRAALDKAMRELEVGQMIMVPLDVYAYSTIRSIVSVLNRSKVLKGKCLVTSSNAAIKDEDGYLEDVEGTRIICIEGA
jgi:hypothetical protein